MREIKFKAIRKDNGMWVYGDLVHHYSIKNGERTDHVSIGIDLDFYEVIPETICQFTTLKDKNGVEIYEGDIIEFVTFFTKDTVVEQVWIDEHACLHPFFDPFYIDDEQGAGMVDETIKVLGNIHDKAQQKQALIDMMRGDEEIGLYDDNPKTRI